ncbi:SDR family oxidoreductase [Pelagibacteraceae bacterium]|nr:SDR family oxidoreductase [Pelagibacteraceae bacterium]
MTDYLKKFRLDKKTAYVVGGLGLIGKQVSTAYAMAGAKTIILDINKKEGLSFQKKMINLGYDVSFIFFDCSKTLTLENNFLKIRKNNENPDIFINCSYPRTKDWSKNSFDNVTFKSFQKNIDVHMNSYAWLAKLAAESMKKKKTGGCIVQLGSIYGTIGQDQNVYKNTVMKENMTYSTIKGGIVNLTRQMASHYGKFNIRVNTLCPGGLKGGIAGRKATQSLNFIKQYSKKTPLKRLGSAEEIASVALFLSSEAASYITGSTIIVDGGITAV